MMKIEKQFVGGIIGKSGVNIKDIVRKSGGNIRINFVPVDEHTVKIEINGEEWKKKKAYQLIKIIIKSLCKTVRTFTLRNTKTFEELIGIARKHKVFVTTTDEDTMVKLEGMDRNMRLCEIEMNSNKIIKRVKANVNVSKHNVGFDSLKIQESVEHKSINEDNNNKPKLSKQGLLKKDRKKYNKETKQQLTFKPKPKLVISKENEKMMIERYKQKSKQTVAVCNKVITMDEFCKLPTKLEKKIESKVWPKMWSKVGSKVDTKPKAEPSPTRSPNRFHMQNTKALSQFNRFNLKKPVKQVAKPVPKKNIPLVFEESVKPPLFDSWDEEDWDSNDSNDLEKQFEDEC